MGQYKVPQNVESEDRIIGPLTLKEFMYALIGVIWAVLTFQIFKKAIPLFIIIGIPPALLFLALGLYKREDQPFETLFLAIVRYLVVPRQRVWFKEPELQLFTAEAPKKVVAAAPHRDPREVRGQLEKLATVVDTRGWTSKQADVSEPDDRPQLDLAGRIYSPDASPTKPASQIASRDDLFDLEHNQQVRSVNALLEDAEAKVREQAMERMQQAATAPQAPTPEPVPAPPATPVAPPTPEPVTTTPPAPESVTTPAAPPLTPADAAISVMTNPAPNDILKMAIENQELTVGQVAAQANKYLPLTEGQIIIIPNEQSPIQSQNQSPS